MALTWDKAKRQATLSARGLDFADADEAFAGDQFEFEDDRTDYGEQRYVTVGFLRDRMVIIVWTQRGNDRHIISMRKANDREQRNYRDRVGRS